MIAGEHSSRIQELLTDEPGLSCRAIAKRLNLPESSIRSTVKLVRDELNSVGIESKGDDPEPADDSEWLNYSLQDDVHPSKLETREPFSSLFPINPAVLSSLVDSMERTGFHPDAPITVWGNVVVDGHTRLSASKTAKIPSVPIIKIAFPDEAAALEWAKGNQRNRRNLTDAELLRYIEAHPLPGKGEHKKATPDPRAPIGALGKRTVASTAKELGRSEKDIERASRVAKQGDDQLKEQVYSGEKTVFAAEAEIKARAGGPAEPEPTEEEKFLESIPVRKKLSDRCREIFDRDANAFRKVEKHLIAMKQLGVTDSRKTGIVQGAFQAKLGFFLLTPHPHSWLACALCNGEGCEKCKTRGYVMPGTYN
ncbi:hypothetical protein [Singulisphaera sp. PoT]|uniref:hypothetical protein n=1 Tax=Singulisphaera sp. PoT TaxID=3411797 RepID=UPI003BF4DE6D